MNTSLEVEAANSILNFLQNIDNDDDVHIFLRIAIDALANAAEAAAHTFDLKAVLSHISNVDNRIKIITAPDGQELWTI